jgi:hypothetical protein
VTAAVVRRRLDPTDRVFPVASWLAVLQSFSVAAVASVWVTITYRLWDASLRVPLYQDQSDARLIANLV